jgi:hypothetical protein
MVSPALSEVCQGASHLLSSVAGQYVHGKHHARGLIGTFEARVIPADSPVRRQARYALDVAATRAGSYFHWQDFESDRETTQERAVEVIRQAAELALNPKL